jgi:hypothetical protein
MKRLLIVLTVLCLNGCSLILLMPKKHDPVMFDNLVNTKISVDKLSCEQKDQWNDALDKANKLAVYSELRSDPQANSIKQLHEALTKARDSKNNTFCENILKINKTRINVVIDAWKGR